MAQSLLRIEDLPEGALDAATVFHARWLPAARNLLASDAILVFPLASYDHRGWRLAAVQDLAREAAPARVNGIVGDNSDAVDEAAEWLAQAPGITGQLLEVG